MAKTETTDLEGRLYPPALPTLKWLRPRKLPQLQGFAVFGSRARRRKEVHLEARKVAPMWHRFRPNSPAKFPTSCAANRRILEA